MDDVVLTFDVDWAPDFMIEYVVDMLVDRGIKSTWFITHDSPATRALLCNTLVEVGIHPSFELADAHWTGGYSDVINRLLEIVPDAKSVRTHKLAQSHEILGTLSTHGLEIDSSLYLPRMSHVVPFDVAYSDGNKHNLVRVPFIWTEATEMSTSSPFLRSHVPRAPGLKVFAFHPVHIYLNSRTMKQYRQLQKLRGYPCCSQEDVTQFISHRSGTKSMFVHVLDNTEEQTKTLSEIVSEWQKKRNEMVPCVEHGTLIYGTIPTSVMSR